MTDKQFYHAFRAAQQYSDPDAFASNVALSDIFPTVEGDDLPALADDLRHVWRYAHITGWGAYAPSRVVTNDDLAQLVPTTDAWIRERTGIVERRIADEGEYTSTMAIEAGPAAP